MTHAPRIASPSTYVFAGWFWTRLIGIVYLIAFASLTVQIVGLVGHAGILPADAYLARAAAVLGSVDRWRFLPTLAWINSSDSFIRGMCVAGSALAALVVCGVAPALVLPVLWALYLSLVVIGREFLGYQWDALLLEAGLLTAFTAPWTLRDRLRDRGSPSWLARTLFVWLLVRLMVESGIVKLASGDPTWRDLTALAYHFWTQPLPTPLAWYANRLPAPLLSAATALTIAIELAAPFLVLAPRAGRAIGAALLVALQGAIALTGNYAFFNILSAGLCVWMLDDATITRALPRRLFARWLHRAAPVEEPRARRWLLTAFAAVTVPVSLHNAGLPGGTVPVIAAAASAVEPFRSVNAYGLFAVMTTERPEIVVEGSADGSEWKEYTFSYQPGDVFRPPPWVAPHQPRLDWQLWFAALGRYEDEKWFRSFLASILDGSQDVRRLLARDPFDGRPPRYVRAMLYQYRFSDAAERRQTGAWWHREPAGSYSPVLAAAAR